MPDTVKKWLIVFWLLIVAVSCLRWFKFCWTVKHSKEDGVDEEKIKGFELISLSLSSWCIISHLKLILLAVARQIFPMNYVLTTPFNIERKWPVHWWFNFRQCLFICCLRGTILLTIATKATKHIPMEFTIHSQQQWMDGWMNEIECWIKHK